MGSALRTERYRLEVWVARDDPSPIDAIELHDHNLDPQENTHIAEAPGNHERVDRLLVEWRQGWPGAKRGGATTL